MRQAIHSTRGRKSISKAKVYGFDTRLQRAADLEGRTMTGFVLHSAETAAARTIQNVPS
jgi:hypothetical protein